jgi:hypothetical protein
MAFSSGTLEGAIPQTPVRMQPTRIITHGRGGLPFPDGLNSRRRSPAGPKKMDLQRKTLAVSSFHLATPIHFKPTRE